MAWTRKAANRKEWPGPEKLLIERNGPVMLRPMSCSGLRWADNDDDDNNKLKFKKSTTTYYIYNA